MTILSWRISLPVRTFVVFDTTIISITLIPTLRPRLPRIFVIFPITLSATVTISFFTVWTIPPVTISVSFITITTFTAFFPSGIPSMVTAPFRTLPTLTFRTLINDLVLLRNFFAAVYISWSRSTTPFYFLLLHFQFCNFWLLLSCFFLNHGFIFNFSFYYRFRFYNNLWDYFLLLKCWWVNYLRWRFFFYNFVFKLCWLRFVNFWSNLYHRQHKLLVQTLNLIDLNTILLGLVFNQSYFFDCWC